MFINKWAKSVMNIVCGSNKVSKTTEVIEPTKLGDMSLCDFPYQTELIDLSGLNSEIIKLMDVPLFIDLDLNTNLRGRSIIYTLTGKCITPNICNTVKYLEKNRTTFYTFDMCFDQLDTMKPYVKLSNLIKTLSTTDELKLKYIAHITKKQADTKRQNVFERNREKRYGKLVNNKGMGTIKTCYFKVHIPSEDELSFRYHYTFVDRPELEYNWIIKSHIKNKYIQVTETEVINLLKELNLDIADLKQETVIGFKKKGKPFRKVTIPSSFDVCGFSTFLE